MKIRGLDNREYKLDLSGKVARHNEERKTSAGHKEVRELLLQLYPFDAASEEVFLPGCGTPLYFDFLLASRRLAVEVQGEQHRKFVPHFHGSPRKFMAQKARDQKKVEWASINGFTLVVLNDDQRHRWTDQLRTAFLGGNTAS